MANFSTTLKAAKSGVKQAVESAARNLKAKMSSRRLRGSRTTPAASEEVCDVLVAVQQPKAGPEVVCQKGPRADERLVRLSLSPAPWYRRHGARVLIVKLVVTDTMVVDTESIVVSCSSSTSDASITDKCPKRNPGSSPLIAAKRSFKRLTKRLSSIRRKSAVAGAPQPTMELTETAGLQTDMPLDEHTTRMESGASSRMPQWHRLRNSIASMLQRRHDKLPSALVC
eukprot:jgi/Chrzof1/1026/Cz01g37170.t1